MNDPIYFVVPGSLDMRTGGYGYDRRIIEGLRSLGRTVETIELAGAYPFPSVEDRAHARARFASLSAGSVAIIDGLAYGALPEVAAREHKRLALVALVHHPLADETGISDAKKQILAQSERTALALARRVVVTSSYTAARLEEYGVSLERIAVVEPGNDAVPLATGSRSIDRAFFGMLCPASFIPRKGHSDLLAALSELKSYSWKLVCVGNTQIDPHCFADVLSCRDALGLSEVVELQGEVGDTELGALYDGADLVVLASLYEGFGMVVTEAIARGIPVVTTTGGALAYTLPAGAGLASAPGDVAGLRANLRRILSDDGVYADLRKNALIARGCLPTWRMASEKFAAALEGVGP